MDAVGSDSETSRKILFENGVSLYTNILTGGEKVKPDLLQLYMNPKETIFT